MTKSIRQMQEDIRLIDLLIEIIDARIPISSMNPDIEKLCSGKGRIVILNKADLADENETKLWMEYLDRKGLNPIVADARKKVTLKSLIPQVNKACREKIERNKRRGIMNRPMRAMVAGIPNVGKSTFINSFAGTSAAKTGNRPGVTRGKQWIRLNKQLELLDTPGLLWPKFEDQDTGRRIALIGSMNDENLVLEELAAYLLTFLFNRYPGAVEERYHLETTDRAAELSQIALARGAVMKGGEADVLKAARLLLEDFRSGRLGRISLESVRDRIID